MFLLPTIFSVASPGTLSRLGPDPLRPVEPSGVPSPTIFSGASPGTLSHLARDPPGPVEPSGGPSPAAHSWPA